MGKKEDKFNFVSSDEFLNEEDKKEETLDEDVIAKDGDEEVEVALEEMQIVKDAKLDELKPLEVIDGSLDDVMEFEFVDESNQDETLDNGKKLPKDKANNVSRKIYIGFEARVLTLVLIVLCLFFGACYFILEACNFSKDRIVTYTETSDVKYSVCTKDNDYYNKSCLNENMQYLTAVTDYITATFKYNVKFSTEIDYNLAYHIVGITKIYDKNDQGKVFYENENLLVERTDISDSTDLIDFSRDVKIDFNAYNDYVKKYQSKYGLDSLASLEVFLYLDEEKETRPVSSILIPLGKTSYGIRKNIPTAKSKEVQLDNDVWNNYNAMCAVCASVLIVLALIVLFRVTSLVLKVTSNKSKYQVMLEHILKEYDELIVTTKNGYQVVGDKQVIKVESFKELIDAKNALNKPIVYSKINSVKSEFIVDDVDKVYKFVLKEADFLD